MWDRSSLSCSTSVRYSAIFFCCRTLQWFSMDKTTGYLGGEVMIPELPSQHSTHLSYFYYSSLTILTKKTYCDFEKAYLLIVSIMSLKRILDVNVYPWWTMGSPSGPSQQSTEIWERKHSESSGLYCMWAEVKEAEVPVLQALTLHTATASLENIGIHFHSRLRQQLVACQIGVVWRSNKVVTQRLRHVLVHLVVLRVEDVSCRTSHEVGKS